MKKLMAFMMSAVMAVSLAACGGSGSSQSTESTTTVTDEVQTEAGDVAQTEAGDATEAGDTAAAELTGRLAAIKEAGVLRVATSPDYPPYEFEDLTKNGQDRYVGADIELAKYIADKLGVDLEINAMAFDACLAAVSEGRVDLTLCGMVPKDERKTAMDFSDVYYDSNEQVLVVLQENADQYQTLADFEGKLVAAQNGSLQYDLAVNQLSGNEVEIITAVTDGIMMLKTGKVDAIALAGVSARNYVANYPELVIVEPEFEYDGQGIVAGVVKNEPEFMDALNEIVKEVRDTEIYQQWLDDATALSNEIQGGN